MDLSGAIRDVRQFKGQTSALSLPCPDLMPSLGGDLSEFPEEPYLAENNDDGATLLRSPCDLSLVTIPAAHNREKQTATECCSLANLHRSKNRHYSGSY